jgi:hypothetical protein
MLSQTGGDPSANALELALKGGHMDCVQLLVCP